MSNDDRQKDQFRQLVSACVRVGELMDTKPTPETARVARSLERLLGGTFGVYARLLSARVSHASPEWKTNAAIPGYLIRTVNNAEVCVPFHLLTDFPDADALSELSSLGKAISIADNGTTICLSGSSTQQKAVVYVADLDFCEYNKLDIDREDIIRRVSKLSANASPEVICSSARWSSEAQFTGRKGPVAHFRPLVEDAETGQEMTALQRAIRVGSSGKMDFITRTNRDGVIEATNVILLIDPADSDAGAAQLSFAQQEAPMTSGSWVPRRLNSLIQFSRYVRWLRGEVESQKAKNIIKATKRGLSLARITLLDAHADRLLDLFKQHSHVLAETALQARRKLSHAIETLAQANPILFGGIKSAHAETLAKLTVASRAPQATSSSRSFDATADVILGDLLNAIDQSILKQSTASRRDVQ